jgi:peptidyl-prolyl cis-trans isomerase C
MKIIMVISCVICGLFLLGNVQALAEDAKPAAVVAKVNGTDIFQSDVDFAFNTFVLPQLKAQNEGKDPTEDQKKQITQQVLNQLILQQVILQAAAKANVVVDDAQVNQQVEAIKAQRQDIPPDKLKQLISNEMTIQQVLVQEVVSKVTIADEEVQKAYEEKKDQFQEPEQIQASHILVKVASDAKPEDKDAARKKIDDILAQAKAGKDFAELAKANSDDPGSKDNGGDLGFFARGVVVKPFEDAAFALKEGEISDVVETQFGYHIIKLTGKKDARTVPFEEAKENLKQGLLKQKQDTEVRNWVTNLRTNAQIEMVTPQPQ